MKPIAAFITPHGYGHATRAIAILEAIQQRTPERELRLFTTVPEHLFATSLSHFTRYAITCDIGVIQHDALNCDVEATRRALDTFLPFSDQLLDELATHLQACSGVLCDISPLGIAAARRAGIPSLLVENFTWDWIYRAHPPLHRHADMLAEIFSQASYHIQAEPVCKKVAGAMHCPPIFRRSRQAAGSVRDQLAAGQRPIVLVSMGGIGYPMEQLLHKLTQHPDILFILAGQEKSGQLQSNCLTLSHQSRWYHPDLISAADLVVCKSGYSTVAECYQSGTRIMAIDREGFAEAAVLAAFVRNMQGAVIKEKQFASGTWLEMIEPLLARPRPAPARLNGADLVAGMISF